MRKSVFGVTQIGVRWKTVSSEATSAISGISCTAVAPVPITATRLPARSAASSHFAVWMTSPAKSCTPSMSGSRGWERKPVAVSRKRVVWLPEDVETTQWRSSSSHRAPSTDHAEAHVPAQVVLVRHVLGVPLELGAAGEPVLPVGVGLEGVGVGDAGDVDRQAGVVVDVPGAAEVVLALEDQQVAVSRRRTPAA